MSDFKIIKNSVNVKGILEELYSILNSNEISMYSNWEQISLQSDQTNDNDVNVSVGKVGNLRSPETDYVHPMFDCKVINHYMKKYGLYRTRVMQLGPKKCYSLHRDLTPRVHIPLVSDENSLMLIDNKAQHLEVGKIYWTDTRKMHTAINTGPNDRIHIVGCVTE